MFSNLKGAFSTKLLAAKSNHTVSRASLYLALSLALLVAILSALFAFAQWQVTEGLVCFQQQNSQETASRIEGLAGMAKHQSNAHRATLNALLSRDASELQEANALRSLNLEAYQALVAETFDGLGLEESRERLFVLMEEYSTLSSKVVELFTEGKKEEALDLRINRLRSLYNQWQISQEHFSKEVGLEARKQQEIYSAVTRTTKAWLVGLLLAPLVLVAIGTLAIATTLDFHGLSNKEGDNWAS